MEAYSATYDPKIAFRDNCCDLAAVEHKMAEAGRNHWKRTRQEAAEHKPEAEDQQL